MTREEVETAALRLDPQARARLAAKLLESLEALSPEENARIWAEEALRRDSELDSDPQNGREADQVIRDARSRLT